MELIKKYKGYRIYFDKDEKIAQRQYKVRSRRFINLENAIKQIDTWAENGKDMVEEYKFYEIFYDKDREEYQIRHNKYKTIDEARAWVDARSPATRSENLTCRESVVDDDPVYNEGWTISAQKQAE